MRVVLDTNVLVRAHKRSTGPAREVLTIVRVVPHVLLSSAFLLNELHRTLHYPRLKALHRLSDAEIEQFVHEIHTIAEVIYLSAVAPVVTSDPDDDPVIQTAVVGHAEVLCTVDRHLRSRQVRAYCQPYGFLIMTDVELLRVLRKERATKS